MKILSIVGARPEFIQAWSVSNALRAHHEEILVHTGQHYDYSMSQSFFEDLGIPSPDYNLGVGSGSHANQLGEMVIRLEKVMLDELPEIVIVRGDTNSTLAGALAASKLAIPVVHIEAGERSYRREMPEEINRVVADQLASLHLCASKAAIERLKHEGIAESAYWVGDVMLDAFLKIKPISQDRSTVIQSLGLKSKNYSLVTIHRASNTNDHRRLQKIVDLLHLIREEIVFPVHPRTRAAIDQIGAKLPGHVALIDPVGYLDMLSLECNARLIATDSGGVQREAYFAQVPCLTLREETEWTETVEFGWNQVVGIEPQDVARDWFDFEAPAEHPPIFGDGRAGERISYLIDTWAIGDLDDGHTLIEDDGLVALRGRRRNM